MLTGREQETAFLENHYKRTGSQILVVYGKKTDVEERRWQDGSLNLFYGKKTDVAL